MSSSLEAEYVWVGCCDSETTDSTFFWEILTWEVWSNSMHFVPCQELYILSFLGRIYFLGLLHPNHCIHSQIRFERTNGSMYLRNFVDCSQSIRAVSGGTSEFSTIHVLYLWLSCLVWLYCRLGFSLLFLWGIATHITLLETVWVMNLKCSVHVCEDV
jgi:hypothetical protein